MPVPDFQDKQAIQKLRKDLNIDFIGFAGVHCFARPLIVWQYAAGNLNSHYRRIVLTSGQGIAGLVYQSQQGVIIQDVSKEIPLSERAEYPIILAENLLCLYAVPLWQSDEIKGILLMAFRQKDLLTQIVLDQIHKTIKPIFCGYTIREDCKGQSLESILRNNHPEKVPIYELLPYHIIQAQEEERKKISRELHDNIAQEMAAVQLKMRQIKYIKNKKDIIEIAEQSDELIGKIYKNLHRFSVASRPEVLGASGLAGAFRSYFEWMKENYGLSVEFKENMGISRYKSELELAFYRIGQEAIRNAGKHSGCDRINISLLIKENDQKKSLNLIIADEGQGFLIKQPGMIGSGVGIYSMYERAELINAILTINSKPGVGTKVSLTADIDDEERKEKA